MAAARSAGRHAAAAPARGAACLLVVGFLLAAWRAVTSLGRGGAVLAFRPTACRSACAKFCFYCLGNCSVAVAARCSVAGRPLLGARAARGASRSLGPLSRVESAKGGEGGPGGAKRGHCKRRALHPTMTTARASAATLRRPSCAPLQTERLCAPRIGDTSQTRGWGDSLAFPAMIFW